MAKKKVKQTKKVSKKPKKKSKKVGLVKGNSFVIPKYIPPKESWFHKVLRWLGF